MSARKPALPRILVLCGLAALVLAGGMATAPARADDDKKKEPPRNTRITSTIRLALQKKLAEAETLSEEKKFVEAEGLLRSALEGTSKITEFERFQLRNYIGYIHYQLGNYDKALVEYEAISKFTGVDPRFTEDAKFTVAQLYSLLSRPKDALKVALRLAKTKTDQRDSSLQVFIAQIYYSLEQFSKGLPHLKRAIKFVKETKPSVSASGEQLSKEEILKLTTPRESWYKLLHAYLYELRKIKQMLAADLEMVYFYPKNDTLLLLAQSLSLLERNKDQLSVLELLYDRGFLEKEQYLVSLATLKIAYGVPYKAAALLEKEMKAGKIKNDKVENLVLLSRAWVEAKEERKAIPPLEKAAKLSERGREYRFLASRHVNLFQWPEAEKALRKALAKGGINNEIGAWIQLGTALGEQKKFRESIQSLEKALSMINRKLPATKAKLNRALGVKKSKRDNKKIKRLKSEIGALGRQSKSAKNLIQYMENQIEQQKYLQSF